MGAVAGRVHGVVVVVEEIIPYSVVHVAVSIVVQAVSLYLPGVLPDVVREVRMGVVNPRVDHRDND